MLLWEVLGLVLVSWWDETSVTGLPCLYIHIVALALLCNSLLYYYYCLRFCTPRVWGHVDERGRACVLAALLRPRLIQCWRGGQDGVAA